MNQVSIDKVCCHATDFEVSSNNRLKLKSGTLDFETGEVENEYPLFEIDDNMISGSSAYHNNENCQISINRNGALIQFTPSKVIHKKHNFYPVNYEQFLQSVDMVQESVESAGLRLNLAGSTTHRIDLERTFQSRYPFYQYHPVFSVMQAKRLNTIDYGETYSFLNKSREICCYDKLHEMNQKKIDTTGISGNWQRAELRLKKNRVIKNDMEITKLSELKRATVFDGLPDIYKEKMSQMIFNNSFSDDLKTFCFESEVELLKSYKERYSRNAVLKYLMTFSIDGMKSLYISPDKLFELMISAGYTERHAFNAKRMLNEALQNYVQDRKDMSVNELYHELREKISA